MTLPGTMFAAIDNIWVMLAIVVISALSSWFQKRNQKNDQAEPWGGEDDETYRPQRTGGSTPPAPANQPLNWEEELKRLLEGQPPIDSTAGASPPPPPPIVRRAPPPPPLPVQVERESRPTGDEDLPSRESAATPWQDASLDSLPEPTKPLAKFEQSAHAYQRAAQLHESVAAHLQRVSDRTEKHGQPLVVTQVARRDASSADARAVVALLRRPAGARQALLASFVLAPPKALEG